MSNAKNRDENGASGLSSAAEHLVFRATGKGIMYRGSCLATCYNGKVAQVISDCLNAANELKEVDDELEGLDREEYDG